MEELTLPLHFEGKDLEIPLQIQSAGYTYRIRAQVAEHEVLFEQDEEGRFRALAADPSLPWKERDLRLAEAIAEQINELLRPGR